MIKNYVNHVIYENTILFYTEWELYQMLVMAVMMLYDDSDKLMTPFRNNKSLLLCLSSQNFPYSCVW